MKKYLLFLLLITGTLTLNGQAPEGFSFQAIVRDALGNPLVTQAVSFRFTIIKGTPIGADVFQEIHNVTTDDFGAVSLVINNGTGKVGVFENIDWGADSYFLKVELDKTGGSSYTDMGTSQLMSVPYALHAKTAANGFSGNYNDLTNKPITDGSETKVSAGSLIIVTGTGTSTDPYMISGSNGSETIVSGGDNIITSGSGTSTDPYIIRERIHYVGESWGGGIVYYVYDNGRHGLIAATTDQDPGIGWSNGTKRYTNTTGDGVRAGEMNTTLIVALQTNDNPMSNFAAKVCVDYTPSAEGLTFGDWYLPSKYELGILFIYKDLIGGFSGNYYWSSTEFSSVSAWGQNFSNGVQNNMNKTLPYGVRAIRAF